jgi:hypothetical protein
MPDYVVQTGDCLYSIAQAHGFRDWRPIYDHPQNEDFRRRRPNPNVIYAGDVLFIPDLAPRQVPVPTGSAHTFRLRGLRTVLRLKLQNIDRQPLANADYVLEVEGTRHEGQTGSGGELEATSGGPPVAADDFIAIVLLELDDNPVVGERYTITLADGSERTGQLYDHGSARIEGIPAGDCQISFPDLDGGNWEAA